MAVTAVTATAASDRMESDSDSDKSSDNSGLKRKAAALKVGVGQELPASGAARSPASLWPFLLPHEASSSLQSLPCLACF